MGEIQTTRYRLAALLLLALLINAACDQGNGSRPPTNSISYNSIRDGKDWQNPFLIVQGNGVTVVLPDDRATVTMDKLQDYLSELPDRYWPYGKIVAVQKAGLRSGNDDELIRQNMEQTIQILTSLGVKIKLWGVTAAQQIVGPERRLGVLHHNWSGEA